MFLGGDEMGRTQFGNNNAYCQDNEISWFDWTLRDENIGLLGFTRRLMAFRRRHPVFRRRRWFKGRDIHGVRDIGWLTPQGTEMTHEEWESGFARSIAVFLNGDELPDPDERGNPLSDDSFLLLFNAHSEPVAFTMPEPGWGEAWTAVLDTNDPLLEEDTLFYKSSEEVIAEARSVVVLRRAQ